jgi:hypothetical protein
MQISPIDQQEVEKAYDAYRLSCDVQGVEFEDVAAKSIAHNLASRPRSYVEYGPYWWAVKRILNSAGAGLGNTMDDEMANRWCVKNSDGKVSVPRTLVAADLFKQGYNDTFFAGTVDFQINDDGDIYSLHDSDMEELVT